MNDHVQVLLRVVSSDLGIRKFLFVRHLDLIVLYSSIAEVLCNQLDSTGGGEAIAGRLKTLKRSGKQSFDGEDGDGTVKIFGTEVQSTREVAAFACDFIGRFADLIHWEPSNQPPTCPCGLPSSLLSRRQERFPTPWSS